MMARNTSLDPSPFLWPPSRRNEELKALWHGEDMPVAAKAGPIAACVPAQAGFARHNCGQPPQPGVLRKDENDARPFWPRNQIFPAREI
jgi:hypothetical protein